MSMQIFIKSRGRPLTLFFNSIDTILDVKKKIFEKEGIPVQQQMLIFNGEHLNDNKTLADYDIQENSTVWSARNRTFDLMARMMGD